MERHRKITEFWNWLPGFRAVAETEHLPTAADRVHVTPAALSRTVRLLEDALERPLFHRRGRRLHLNDDGRVLLDATRQAMRLVHDAAAALGGTALDGPVKIATGGVSQVYTMRALLLARKAYPNMRPAVLTPNAETAGGQLLRGELDLVVSSFVLGTEGLTTELLTHADNAVYCGPSHPLYGRESVSLEELQTHPFTAPPPSVGGQNNDGWPPEIPREIQLTTDRMASGREICASTDLLAVLPDAFAAESPVPLHRMPVDVIPKTPVVVARRNPTGADDLTQRVVELLREVCGTPPQ